MAVRTVQKNANGQTTERSGAVIAKKKYDPVAEFVAFNSAGFREVGSAGIESSEGVIEQAYHGDLYWPEVYELYSRIRRSDPEVGIIRQMFTVLARSVLLNWTAKDPDNAADIEAAEFANSVMADIEGGPARFLETLVSYVPFFGWGFWEIVAGRRDPNWKPPGKDPWRSGEDDNRVGVRRLAWRDPSSFQKWDIDDVTGRLLGMVQLDYPKEEITIPIERALHITFGDPTNPEGLSPLEAIWRLERIKYRLEIIQGMGFEHASGHVKFEVARALDTSEKNLIKEAAASVLTAKEGNYMIVPAGVEAELMDVTFSAAASLLDAIKHYGITKLQMFFGQFVAIATTSNVGSRAAMSDASAFFFTAFNSMMQGFGDQIEETMGRWIFGVANPDAFAGMTGRPILTVSEANKEVQLLALAEFVEKVWPILATGDDDDLAVRRRSGFMPEELPEEPTGPAMEEAAQDEPEPEPDAAAEADDEPPEAEPGDDEPDDESDRDLAVEKLIPPGSQGLPGRTASLEPLPDPEDIETFRADIERLSKVLNINLDHFMGAETIEDEPEIE